MLLGGFPEDRKTVKHVIVRRGRRVKRLPALDARFETSQRQEDVKEERRKVDEAMREL